MSKGSSGFVALLVAIPLLCFPGYTSWKLITKKEVHVIDTMEEFAVLTDKYDWASCEEQAAMLTGYSEDQLADLKMLYDGVYELRAQIKEIKLTIANKVEQ